MSPQLKEALEALDQAIDRLEGQIDMQNAEHRRLLEKLQLGRSELGGSDAERAKKAEAIQLKLDAVIEQVESVLED